MRFVRLVPLVMAASTLMVGCADDTASPPDGVPYQLGFVTIQAPASVAPGDTIPVVAAGPFRVVVHYAGGDSVVGEVAVP